MLRYWHENLRSLREMFNIRCSGRLGPSFAIGSFRSVPVKTDLQKLILEYFAIEKMDRIVRAGEDQRNDTELIGLRAREMRRQEIIGELTACTIHRRRLGETD